jgi:hypothetical protein
MDKTVTMSEDFWKIVISWYNHVVEDEALFVQDTVVFDQMEMQLGGSSE